METLIYEFQMLLDSLFTPSEDLITFDYDRANQQVSLSIGLCNEHSYSFPYGGLNRLRQLRYSYIRNILNDIQIIGKGLGNMGILLKGLTHITDIKNSSELKAYLEYHFGIIVACEFNRFEDILKFFELNTKGSVLSFKVCTSSNDPLITLQKHKIITT